MKIICVGRNYAAHAKELGNAVQADPVIFLKPDTAALPSGQPFYLPDWTKDLHYECELVYKVAKNGKYIKEEFAWNYVSDVTLGIDFTARDIQSQLKTNGLPWELAKAFDNSAVVGEWHQLTDLLHPSPLEFKFMQNGQKVQHGNSANMLHPLPKIISFVSQFISLRKGDLIFTGTPEGVGKVEIGDQFHGSLLVNGEEKKVLSTLVK